MAIARRSVPDDTPDEQPVRGIVVGVAGTAKIPSKGVVALVDDWLGEREEISFVFSAAAEDQVLYPSVEYLSEFAKVNDISITFITDNTTGKALDDGPEGSYIKSVRAATGLVNDLVQEEDLGQDVVLLLAFDPDSEEDYYTLERALEKGITVLDLTDALEELTFDDEAQATADISDGDFLDLADDDDEDEDDLEDEPVVVYNGVTLPPRDKMKIRDARSLIKEHEDIPTRKVGQMTLDQCRDLLYGSGDKITPTWETDIPATAAAVSVDYQPIDEAQNLGPNGGCWTPAGLQEGWTPPVVTAKPLQEVPLLPAVAKEAAAHDLDTAALVAEAREAVREGYEWVDTMVTVIARAVNRELAPFLNSVNERLYDIEKALKPADEE